MASLIMLNVNNFLFRPTGYGPQYFSNQVPTNNFPMMGIKQHLLNTHSWDLRLFGGHFWDLEFPMYDGLHTAIDEIAFAQEQWNP